MSKASFVSVFEGNSNSLIYIGVPDKDTFLDINGEYVDHGKQPSGYLLTKTIEAENNTVIFQHWIEKPYEPPIKQEN